MSRVEEAGRVGGICTTRALVGVRDMNDKMSIRLGLEIGGLIAAFV